MLSGVVTMDAKKVIRYADLDTLLKMKGVALKDEFPDKTDMVVQRKMTSSERIKYAGDTQIPFLKANEKLNPSTEIGETSRVELTKHSEEHIQHIKEVTESPAEWLSELVQNALDLEDLTQMGISIDNEKGSLIWWHNGKDESGKSFSSSNREGEIDDLTALLQLGSSNKSNDLQSEGRFGLGFKYWPKWWETTTLLVNEIKLKWKLEDSGRYFEMAEGNLGARYLQPYPSEFADKTIFVFEGKTDDYIDVQWHHLQHVLWGLSTRNFSLNFTIQIDGEANTFHHEVKPNESPLESMQIFQFSNEFSGESETLSFPKEGELVTMKLRDLPESQHEHIEKKVTQHVTSLKSTMDSEQKKQLDLKKDQYLSVKDISLVYITDSVVPEHGCLSSLFPISGSIEHGWNEDENCYVNNSRYIFDAPFEIERNRKYLKLANDEYHSALFSGFQMMAEMLIQRDFQSKKPIRDRIESIHKCFAKYNVSRKSEEHSFFKNAKIWPTKHSELRSITCGIKSLRSSIRFFWESSIEQLPENQKTTAFETLNLFIHEDEVILQDGPVHSWILERTPHVKSGFLGDFEAIKAIPPVDIVSVNGFETLRDTWQAWLPIPIESLQNGAEWLEQKDQRLHFIENPADLETSHEAAKELLDSLLELEGDIITYLSPNFKNVILSLVEFQKESFRPGIRMINNTEFIELDLENPGLFYGSLLSAAFRGKKIVHDDEENEDEFLIPKNTFLAHLENYPQQKGYWPVFGIIIDQDDQEQEMVMFEQPEGVRQNIHVAFTYRLREDENWLTLWSVNTSSKKENWLSNGFLPQNENKGNETRFPPFATRRTTHSDLDLVYFSHWPSALQNLCQELIETYAQNTRNWNRVFHIKGMTRPRPHNEGEIYFEKVKLVTQTTEMKNWINQDKTMLIPAFIVPYQLSEDNCRNELVKNKITGSPGESILRDHRAGKLTQYDNPNNHWLQCAHNSSHKSAYPDRDGPYSTPDTVITRTMSLSMLLLDTILSDSNDTELGYDVYQALMLCAANLDIQRGSFNMYESWIQDNNHHGRSSNKGRKIRFQKIREESNRIGEARLRTDQSFAVFNAISPLGFREYLGAEKTQQDNLNSLFYSNINLEHSVWTPCHPDYEPKIPISNSEYSLIELKALASLNEEEKHLVERYNSTVRWLFSTPKLTEKIDNFAKLWLKNLRSKSDDVILNGLECLCRLWQASAQENYQERFSQWFNRNTTPFSKESAPVLRNLAHGGFWSTQHHLEILEQMLAFAGSSGQVLLTFDDALIQNRDLLKNKFSDYFLVADRGMLSTFTQKQIYIDVSKKDTLFINELSLKQIIGETVRVDRELQLENRFQFAKGTKIFRYARQREERIPSQFKESILNFEEIIGFEKAFSDAIKVYNGTSAMGSKNLPLLAKYEFLQKWIRVNCLSRIIKESTGNMDVERFLKASRLQVEKKSKEFAVHGRVCIGMHGFRLSWEKEGGFLLQLGEGSDTVTLTKIKLELTSAWRNDQYFIDKSEMELEDVLIHNSNGSLDSQLLESLLLPTSPLSLWDDLQEQEYREKFQPLSEKLTSLRQKRNYFFDTGWEKEGTNGTQRYLDDRIRDWKMYVEGKNPGVEVSNTFWKEEMYDGMYCMRASIRSTYTTLNPNETLFPRETFRLLKPKQFTAFGRKPEHWSSVDFIGNCLYFSANTASYMATNAGEYKFNINPEKLVERFESTFYSPLFEMKNAGRIEVRNVLTSSENSVDDGAIFIDKFHLIEMLAFLKGTESLRS